MNYLKKYLLFILLLFVLLNINPVLNASSGWGFRKNSNNERPDIGSYEEIIDGLAYYLGEDEKTVYLTFDVGYDNGNLEKILDTLKEKNIKACFFVTGDFVNRFSELLIRIKQEGHLIGSHTYNHRDITKLSYDELKNELDLLDKKVFELCGEGIDPYFRPPEGKFDRRSLEIVKELGYNTIFWSIAYVDWYQDKSFGKEYVLKNVINNLHNGAICLMHTVSSDNANYLENVIDEIYNKSYSIKNIDSIII